MSKFDKVGHPNKADYEQGREDGSQTNPFRGAGRKPSPPELKKIPVGVALPRWLVEWLRAQTESHAVLIEDALKRRHKLKPPAIAKRVLVGRRVRGLPGISPRNVIIRMENSA